MLFSPSALCQRVYESITEESAAVSCIAGNACANKYSRLASGVDLKSDRTQVPVYQKLGEKRNVCGSNQQLCLHKSGSLFEMISPRGRRALWLRM